MSYKYIELFAGCGGMSLGLKSAGFELLFANEISPIAAETYSYNLIHNKNRTNNPEGWFHRLYLADEDGNTKMIQTL